MGNRPTIALIKEGAIRHNYREIRSKLGGDTGVMAVVKANAYGHGDLVVARALEDEGCECLGVAIVEEAIRLREGGIEQPIVILGGVYADQLKEVISYNLTPVIFDIAIAKLLDYEASRTGVKQPIHLKVDTGMGRLGVLPEEIQHFLEDFASFKNLILEGVISHFAEAESESKEFTDNQLEVFLESVKTIEKAGYNPGLRHIANSAAIVDNPKTHLELVRPGIMLYGSYPSQRYRSMIDLRPALTLKSHVLQVKKVPPGFSVSYGRTFTTKRESTLAAVPIGYGDGFTRLLSGRGEAIVRGRRVPTLGIITMDVTMIDVTELDGVAPGDEVVFIGSMDGESITSEEIAEKLGTISYEILCNISARVPRVYV